MIEYLIENENTDTFLLGSRSDFDDLSYDVLKEVKDIHPHIKRIYVRAEFPYIDDDYNEYLLELYDESYFPQSVLGAGRASYVKRNYEMIEKSDFCVFYYDESYTPIGRRSGTKIAFEYASKKGVKI